MELINEYNNRHFAAYAETLGMVGTKINNLKEFNRTLQNLAFDNEYYAASFFKLVNDELNPVFLNIGKDGSISLRHQGIIEFPMSAVSEIYLKNILRSDYAKLFIDDDVIEKLNEHLNNTPDFDFSQIFHFCGALSGDTPDGNFISKFRTLRQAIHNKSTVSFSNTTRTEKVFENQKAIPTKIEFSVMTRKFYVSMWGCENNRPFKCVLNSLYDIKIIGENNDFDYEQIISYMQDKRNAEPIVMNVTDKYKNNAMERAELIFSIYEHENQTNKDGSYTIKIWYYSYDEMEIINNIMSFGSAIKVLSPESVIDKIKERIFF